jgi:hypothetical protein
MYVNNVSTDVLAESEGVFLHQIANSDPPTFNPVVFILLQRLPPFLQGVIFNATTANRVHPQPLIGQSLPRRG